jgi:hypothetical protein
MTIAVTFAVGRKRYAITAPSRRLDAATPPQSAASAIGRRREGSRGHGARGD